MLSDTYKDLLVPVGDPQPPSALSWCLPQILSVWSCQRPRTLWRALSGEWRKGHWQGAASGPKGQLAVWEMASPAAGFWWTIVRPEHTRGLAGGGGAFLEGVQVWAGEGRLGRPPPASKPWPACLFVRGGSLLGNVLMQCPPKCQVQSKPPL